MSRHRLHHHLTLAGLVLSTNGCTTWTRLPPTAPAPRHGAVQVWSAGRVTVLRDVVVGPDSVVGRRLAPESACVAFPSSAVDSLRTAGSDLGTPLIVGTGAAIFLAYMWASGLPRD